MLLRGEGLHAISNDCNLVPLRLQVTLEAESYAGFVFNDLDLGHSTPLPHIHSLCRRAGRACRSLGGRRPPPRARCPRHSVAAQCSTNGSTMVNVLPTPTALSRRICPPRASMICCTIESPMPVL